VRRRRWRDKVTKRRGERETTMAQRENGEARPAKTGTTRTCMELTDTERDDSRERDQERSAAAKQYERAGE